MDCEYILFFDDVGGVLTKKTLKALKLNDDETYSFTSLPMNFNGNLREFQSNESCHLVYLLNGSKDSDVISKYLSKAKRVEPVGNEKYNLVSIYRKSEIFVSPSNVGSKLDEITNRRFIRYDDFNQIIPCDGLYILRHNENDTVSVDTAPVVIKGSIKQYELITGNILVFALNDDSMPYIRSEESIMELEPTEEKNKYSFISPYNKGKVLVKTAKINVERIN